VLLTSIDCPRPTHPFSHHGILGSGKYHVAGLLSKNLATSPIRGIGVRILQRLVTGRHLFIGDCFDIFVRHFAKRCNCFVTACIGREFYCPEGYCIPAAWMCDHIVDCRNADDERNCCESFFKFLSTFSVSENLVINDSTYNKCTYGTNAY